MALVPPPHLSLTPRDQAGARRLRRLAAVMSLTGGTLATSLGVQSLFMGSAGALDWALAGVGVALVGFGLARLRPRDAPPELTIPPARTHVLYGICFLLLGAAAPSLGLNRWLAPLFGICGLVELGIAVRRVRGPRHPSG